MVNMVARRHLPGWVALSRIVHWARTNWVDIAWVIFVLLNLLAMRLVPRWQTVPFLIIWLSLMAVYGFRLWHLGSTLLTVLTVTLATGGLIDSRRRVAAMDQMKRVSEHNLVLLDQQRQFLQDASHELGTPIAIALGHVELIEQVARDKEIAADARVAAAELLRIRRLTSRLLLLASTDSPDFLNLAPVDVEEILVEALHRWSHVPRQWSLGTLPDGWVHADADRLTMALDALIENAVDHTKTTDQIELSAHREDETIVIAVTDTGPGIPAADIERIFGRFARIDVGRNRTAGGFGLGLAIVKAIVEAHHGSVHVSSAVGRGATFGLHLPATAPGAMQPVGQRALQS